eukprot:CAMPEP_0119199446 /NCGR_PEP_ID=MMETSP1316-20130426/22731_1 /TAXON_ID=41880 /ORGANISM="Pycnococcus provasolii, Strain RCC2336" /LENGTH=51 /DNA_ID=CAMNT_0007195441 /DNA_START=28 /DNA_END=180 /DNA_ORIENTATION=+
MSSTANGSLRFGRGMRTGAAKSALLSALLMFSWLTASNAAFAGGVAGKVKT